MQFTKNLKVSDPHETQSEGQMDTPLKPFATFRFSDPFGCYNIKGHHAGSESWRGLGISCRSTATTQLDTCTLYWAPGSKRGVANASYFVHGSHPEFLLSCASHLKMGRDMTMQTPLHREKCYYQVTQAVKKTLFLRHCSVCPGLPFVRPIRFW